MKRITTLFYTTTLLLCSFSLNAQDTNHPIEYNQDHPVEAIEEFGDLFPGTIERISNRYILKRCTSGGYDYVLEFTHPEQKEKIDELLKANSQFWINVFAVYREVGEEHHLKVKDLDEIHLNQSCHLNDFLEQLEQNPELLKELQKAFPQKNRE